MGKLFGGLFAVWGLVALLSLGITGAGIWFGFQQVTACWVTKDANVCLFY